MVKSRHLGSILAAMCMISAVHAQSQSDCTCPSASTIFTTVFYDPNTVSGGTAVGTGVSSGTGMGGTNMGGTSTGTGVGPSSTAINSNVSGVVAAINSLTRKSLALQSPASSLTTTNGPLIAVGLGPLPGIIAGFSDIVATATGALGAFSALGTVPAGANSDAIFDAFRDFVIVHQQLLNILIGKAGLFTAVPIVGQPVAEALRGIEKIVDTVAFGLINAVQARANDLQQEANGLSSTITTAIGAFSGTTATNP